MSPVPPHLETTEPISLCAAACLMIDTDRRMDTQLKALQLNQSLPLSCWATDLPRSLSLPLFLPFSLSLAHTHTHTHREKHTHTHKCRHTHTRTAPEDTRWKWTGVGRMALIGWLKLLFCPMSCHGVTWCGWLRVRNVGSRLRCCDTRLYQIKGNASLRKLRPQWFEFNKNTWESVWNYNLTIIMLLLELNMWTFCRSLLSEDSELCWYIWV